MKKEILKYLSKYTEITAEIEHAISASLYVRNFKKGTILLHEGSISRECYFILKGCIISYFLKDGEEKTIDFYTEEQSVVPTTYGTSKPSDSYLECLENVVVCIGNQELETETFQKYPQLESLSRIIGEKVIAQQLQSFIQFKTSTPLERYLYLIKTRPDLTQRVPQHQIASYLGIKAESLSRIRKRIADKKVIT